MGKKRTLLVVAAMLGLAALGAAQTSNSKPADLKVGDSAPNLEVARWVKGGPVDALAKGKIYVVEFWATWCGPCKMSIPHLTELQKKFGDKATFIGVSSFEKDWNGVGPFVQSMGDKMDYNVAMDKIGKPTDREGFMAKNWMEAAHQNGIPTAFVIDKDGKVAWIGHPMELEDPLGKVVDGTWDREAFAKEYSAKMAEQMKAMEAQRNDPANQIAMRYSADRKLATKSGKWDAVLSDCDAIDKLGTKYAETGALWRFDAYVKSGDVEKVSSYGRKVLSGPTGNNPNVLNSIAWSIVDPKSTLSKRDLDLALDAAERAVSLTKRENGAILDTLAWTYYQRGDKQKAVDTETEALSKAQGDKTDYEAALKTFKGA